MKPQQNLVSFTGT